MLKSLPNGVTAVGNPAKIVGRSMCPSAAAGMDVALRYVLTKDGKTYDSTLRGDDEGYMDYVI